MIHALVGPEVFRPGLTEPPWRNRISPYFAACSEVGSKSKENGKSTVKSSVVGGYSISGITQQVDTKTHKKLSGWDVSTKVEKTSFGPLLPIHESTLASQVDKKTHKRPSGWDVSAKVEKMRKDPLPPIHRSALASQVDKKTHKRPSGWDVSAEVEKMRKDRLPPIHGSTLASQAFEEAVGPRIPQPVKYFSAANGLKDSLRMKNDALLGKPKKQSQCPFVIGAKGPRSRLHHPHTECLQGMSPVQYIQGATPMQMQPHLVSAGPPFCMCAPLTSNPEDGGLRDTDLEDNEQKDISLEEGQKLVVLDEERLEMGSRCPVGTLKAFGDHQGPQCFTPPVRTRYFSEVGRKPSRNRFSKFSKERGLLGKRLETKETSRADYLVRSRKEPLYGQEEGFKLGYTPAREARQEEGFKLGYNPAREARQEDGFQLGYNPAMEARKASGEHTEKSAKRRRPERLAEDGGNHDLGRPSKRIALEQFEAASLSREEAAAYKPEKIRAVLDTTANTSGVDTSKGFCTDGGNGLARNGRKAIGANGPVLDLREKGRKVIGPKDVYKRVSVPEGKQKVAAGFVGFKKDIEPHNAESQEFYAPYEKSDTELKGPILQYDQYAEYCKEYRARYRVYNQLNISLESDKEDFEKFSRDIALAEAAGEKNKVEVLYQEVREAYRLSSKRFKRMQKTFSTLHEELKVIKQHCKEFSAKVALRSYKGGSRFQGSMPAIEKRHWAF